MPAPTRVHPAVAAGFTALLASIVAAVFVADWRWSIVGIAALLAGAVWSSALERR